MILGLGIDVVEVGRIAKAMRSPRFVERILTANERQVAKVPWRVAGRWAAKEAVAKALSCKLKWHDVEISSASDGAPVVNVNPEVFLLDNCQIHISVTHERGYAAAVAILESIEGSSLTSDI